MIAFRCLYLWVCRHVVRPVLIPLSTDIGIFKDTLLPTLGYSSALAILNYGLGRSTDALVTKDVCM